MNTNIQSEAYDNNSTLRFMAVDSEAQSGEWIETNYWEPLEQ